jgi:hypothetical protein
MLKNKPNLIYKVRLNKCNSATSAFCAFANWDKQVQKCTPLIRGVLAHVRTFNLSNSYNTHELLLYYTVNHSQAEKGCFTTQSPLLSEVHTSPLLAMRAWKEAMFGEFVLPCLAVYIHAN